MEKYFYVIFFFNGGREQEFEGENCIFIFFLKVVIYDLKLEMSVVEVIDVIIVDIDDN